MTVPEVGITLPSIGRVGELGGADVAELARHVEQHGLDAVSVADLILGDGTPAMEPTVTVAVAATATQHVTVGFGVLALPLRPVARVGAQVATLQQVSSNRIQLGVGIGGFPGGPFWQAVGGPADQRGRHMDDALAVLPDLIAGRPTELGRDTPPVTLAPAARVPPIYIGGTSEAALRRTARFGEGWLPSGLPPSTLASNAAHLAELAGEHDRPMPKIEYGTHAVFDPDAEHALVRSLIEEHGMAPETATEIPLTGEPEQLAERFTTYAEAGADRITISADGGNWYRNIEVIAAAKALLD